MRLISLTVSSIFALVVASAAVTLGPQRASVQTDHTVTKAIVDRWMTDLSNWGRWGKDDERGTLNLLTPERRRSALAAARDGASVSLSHDLSC